VSAIFNKTRSSSAALSADFEKKHVPRSADRPLIDAKENPANTGTLAIEIS